MLFSELCFFSIEFVSNLRDTSLNRSVPQSADKDVRTVKIDKSFRPPFSKGGAVKGA